MANSTSKPLRVVTFNFLPIGYTLLTDWINAQGHQHVLAVTTPGPKSRPTPSYKQLVAVAPRDVDVLVTTRLKTVATPLIRELKPDLITCLSFPYRITPELCELPTYGAVNIHPAVLPAYRGPNPLQQFYEGADVFGATAHWIAKDYDTGNILSQKIAPMPDQFDETVFETWIELMAQTIHEGMAQAISGAKGYVQDDSKASYAAPFSEAETYLNWHEPVNTLKRKTLALNLVDAGQAKARVDAETLQVLGLEIISDRQDHPRIGKCLERTDNSLDIQAVDGVVRIKIQTAQQ